METPSQVLICRKCSKPVDSFVKGRRICYECMLAYNREHYGKNGRWEEADKPDRNEYVRQWREKNREKVRSYAIEFRKQKLASMTPDELAEFRRSGADKVKQRSAIIKDEVFMAYGGWRCVCCGETEKSFLSIDHVLNNGSQLKREGVHANGTRFYRWLKRNGFPKDFQILCMNCNVGKYRNGGICPHQERRNDYPVRE